MEDTSQELEVRNSVVLTNSDYAIYQVIDLLAKQFQKHSFQPTNNRVKKPLVKIISSPETLGFILLAILSIKNRVK